MTEIAHGELEGDELILRGLKLAVALTVGILCIETLGAFLSRSLSLTVDAIHNIPDILAFSASWTALKVVEHGTSGKYTFGKHRFEVFAALLNAVLVLGTGLFFGYEAVILLLRGVAFAGPVNALWLVIVALPTFALRTTNLAVLGRVPRRARDMNLRGVILHLASDIVITVAILVAGVTLLFAPSLSWIDAVAALLVATVLAYEAIPLFLDGWEVLTERIPRHLSIESISEVVKGAPGVTEVHDIHVWSVCPTLVCMTAHVGIEEMTLAEGMDLVRGLKARMAESFGILHAIFEIEIARTHGSHSSEGSGPSEEPLEGLEPSAC